MNANKDSQHSTCISALSLGMDTALPWPSRQGLAPCSIFLISTDSYRGTHTHTHTHTHAHTHTHTHTLLNMTQTPTRGFKYLNMSLRELVSVTRSEEHTSELQSHLNLV